MTAERGGWRECDWSPWYWTVLLGSSVSFRKLVELWRTQTSCICTRQWASTKASTSVLCFLVYSIAYSRDSTICLMNWWSSRSMLMVMVVVAMVPSTMHACALGPRWSHTLTVRWAQSIHKCAFNTNWVRSPALLVMRTQNLGETKIV